MIDLSGIDYITVLIEAGRIEEGSIVQKPTGEVLYKLTYKKPEQHLIRSIYRRYGRDVDIVYLRHDNGIYYQYPVDLKLKIRVYKYDLQKEIDDTCEY